MQDVVGDLIAIPGLANVQTEITATLTFKTDLRDVGLRVLDSPGNTVHEQIELASR